MEVARVFVAAAIVSAVLLLAGCANGFEQFYTATPAAAQIVGRPAIVTPPSVPKLYAHSSDVNADAKRLAEEGYILIGTSSFSGAANKVHDSQALEQAKKVGASLVLVKSKYQGTVTGTVPWTVPGAPQVATVNTTGTVSAYGNGGYASGTYNANSTITTPGTPTTYQIPYSVVRNEYFASYWAKEDTSKMRLGVRASALPDDLRMKLQRNTGLYVQIVMRGTPAFAANILEGDVITKIGDQEIIDQAGLEAALAHHAGQVVSIGLLRNGDLHVVTVRLNQNP